MSYANVKDIEAELGRPTSGTAETEQWKAWIERVERSIFRGFRRAGLDLRVAVEAGDPTAAEVADVEVARVVDKIQNPRAGETSITKAIDDASVTYRREGKPADPLELTDVEWANLLPGVESTGAFSTRPGFEPDLPDLTSWA